MEKRICLAEIVTGNERIEIRVYLLLGQSANQLLFKQRLDTERDELLVFQLKQDVVQYALSLLKDILGEW
ncbi:MAG TPA: hypothetical protein VJY12_10440 [Dysgonamonadaceae bacterium]|nr:hypothetical protein [Dysgonamonadaceae bacterium]